MTVGDILDEKAVKEAVLGCGYVYNFAGIADIDIACQKPLESIRTNILGNSNLLEACRLAGVRRFIYASSLYVYSNAGSFYRSTKQACELIIENYNEVFGLPYTILRYGSLYGPRADERNGVYRILKQALLERKITREGDGEEVREYIHVLDAARYSVEILAEEFANQYVIITGHQQIKLKDFLLMVKEILNNEVEIEYRAPTFNYHYEITPYSFSPKIGKKLIGRSYLDLGQGVLDCLNKLQRELTPLPCYDGVIVKDEQK
jgi:UDP-glucose 4-epimerase